MTNKKILLLHGPNLNLLGKRETDIYGKLTLDDINERVKNIAQSATVEVSSIQSNHEGELIDAIHDAEEWASGIIFNPGAYTHTSIALYDAISAVDIPVVEVHMSNIYKREKFRHKSLIAAVCIGQISGLGWRSYMLGLEALIGYWSDSR